MNPRERFLRAIRKQSVDKVPKHAFWTPEILEKAKEKTGFEDPDEYFGIEVKNVINTCFNFNPDFDIYFTDLKETGREKKRNWDEWDEEKQTDVNIALHLLNEAYNDSYDTAMIMTNDTDLIPAIKMLRHVFPQKKVGVLFPINRRSHELIQTCNFFRYTKNADFSQCQFPDPLVLPSGRTINKPTVWR